MGPEDPLVCSKNQG